MDKKPKVPFIIVSRPSYIHLECPYCDEEIEINWGDLNVPNGWDYWDDVICPDCGKTIKLGDWEYD